MLKSILVVLALSVPVQAFAEPANATKSPESALTIAGWSLVGSSVVALSTSAGMFSIATRADDAVRTAEPIDVQTVHSVNSLAASGMIVGGVGVATLVAGVVLLLVPSPTKHHSKALHLTPFSIHGTF